MKPNWKRLRDGQLDWEIFQLRSQVLSAIRQFFHDRNYLEIESPLLTPYPTLDANIQSVSVSVEDHLGSSYSCFLHTSPEHAMKKLVAAGAKKIYYLGKVFRNQEISLLHNPEFSMLEWYQTDADYHTIQDETEALVGYIAQSVLDTFQLNQNVRILDLTPSWDRIPLRQLFLERTGTDLADCLTLPSIQKVASDNDIQICEEDDLESVFFKIYLDKMETNLGFPKPVFIEDYPLCMGMMAKPKDSDPGWVERTELYVGGIELANGYSELTDPDEQRRRFLHDLTVKNKPEHLLDGELIEALRSGLPPTAGIALGVDRLIMLLANKSDIRDVLLFPFHQIIEKTRNH
ncbi:EF-P lysine aminoacylase GenX [candidate division KSB1 bacterium]|nr:EF-P lysine aminoacylase GenX [candidate division KSB1 bacterium]